MLPFILTEFFTYKTLSHTRLLMELKTTWMLWSILLKLRWDLRLVSFLLILFLRKEKFWTLELSIRLKRNRLSGVSIVLDMKLKILNLQIIFKKVWSYKLKLKEEREQVFWPLKEKKKLISILQTLKSKHKFCRLRVKQKV